MKQYALVNTSTNLVENVLLSENVESLGNFGSSYIIVETKSGDFYDLLVANIGDTYHSDGNFFTPPQPYPSWSLNMETKIWEPPSPKPNDGMIYNWDEETQKWIYFGDPRPYPSWSWDKNFKTFVPPIPHPNGLGNGGYRWDEENQTWIEDPDWQK
jgi:hypothetical protein